MGSEQSASRAVLIASTSSAAVVVSASSLVLVREQKLVVRGVRVQTTRNKLLGGVVKGANGSHERLDRVGSVPSVVSG